MSDTHEEIDPLVFYLCTHRPVIKLRPKFLVFPSPTAAKFSVNNTRELRIVEQRIVQLNAFE